MEVSLFLLLISHPFSFQITFGQNRMELIMTTPMHSLFSIWQEINAAVQTSIEQRSVLLCPVTPRQFDVKPISVNIGASRQVSSFTVIFVLLTNFFFKLLNCR